VRAWPYRLADNARPNFWVTVCRDDRA
jgi:hypothetical protein